MSFRHRRRAGRSWDSTRDMGNRCAVATRSRPRGPPGGRPGGASARRRLVPARRSGSSTRRRTAGRPCPAARRRGRRGTAGEECAADLVVPARTACPTGMNVPLKPRLRVVPGHRRRRSPADRARWRVRPWPGANPPAELGRERRRWPLRRPNPSSRARPSPSDAIGNAMLQPAAAVRRTARPASSRRALSRNRERCDL